MHGPSSYAAWHLCIILANTLQTIEYHPGSRIGDGLRISSYTLVCRSNLNLLFSAILLTHPITRVILTK
jgi:hypothetical protein